MSCYQNLTQMNAHVNTIPMPAKSGIGFSSSNYVGGHTATSAVFLCPQYGKSFYGRAMRETFGSAGCLCAGLLTRMVPSTLLAGGERSSRPQHRTSIMTNLIPIASRIIAGTPTETVNARRLHEFLEVGRDYSNWLRARIKQYSFAENEDYVIARQNGRAKICATKSSSKGRGGHNAKDHYLTLDMAKELAMVERNEKGREARRYFIECEKRLRDAKAKLPAAEDDLEAELLKAFRQMPKSRQYALCASLVDRLEAKLISEMFFKPGRYVLQIWEDAGFYAIPLDPEHILTNKHTLPDTIAKTPIKPAVLAATIKVCTDKLTESSTALEAQK